jgi:hypothetical protein
MSSLLAASGVDACEVDACAPNASDGASEVVAGLVFAPGEHPEKAQMHAAIRNAKTFFILFPPQNKILVLPRQVCLKPD